MTHLFLKLAVGKNDIKKTEVPDLAAACQAIK